MPDRRSIFRLLALAGFLLTVALALWLAELRPLFVVIVMALALLLAWAVEWLSWRQELVHPVAQVVETEAEDAEVVPVAFDEPLEEPEPVVVAAVSEEAAEPWWRRSSRRRPSPSLSPSRSRSPRFLRLPRPSRPHRRPPVVVPVEPTPAPPPERIRSAPEPPREEPAPRPPLRPVPPPAPVEPPAPAAPPPPVREPAPAAATRSDVIDLRMRATAQPRRWNLWDLETRAREHAQHDPDRQEEWSYLFVHLRQFATPGRLSPHRVRRADQGVVRRPARARRLMNPALARRQVALAGVALIGALGAIALSRIGEDAPPPPARPAVEWQQATVGRRGGPG